MTTCSSSQMIEYSTRHLSISCYSIKMFDNFMADHYHSWDLVYTDASSGSHIFIGDVQAAVDQDFLLSQRIKTGTGEATQL